jgi:hypothetical protein
MMKYSAAHTHRANISPLARQHHRPHIRNIRPQLDVSGEFTPRSIIRTSTRASPSLTFNRPSTSASNTSFPAPRKDAQTPSATAAATLIQPRNHRDKYHNAMRQKQRLTRSPHTTSFARK